MTTLEEVRPKAHHRVIDLVASAGLDTSDWANYTGADPSRNPKYCYEWCFHRDDRIVLNLWFHDIQAGTDGSIFYAMNARATARDDPNATRRHRAEKLDMAIQLAKHAALEVRVIVCESVDRRNLDDLRTARVRARALDPVSWHVESYDIDSGRAVLRRGADHFPRTGSAWRDQEVVATVEDYFSMLRKELAGQRYNKTEHREALKGVLSGRTDGAIEMKHQNISAVLLELGVMPINGYKPLFNYQQRLVEIVSDRIASDHALDRIAIEAAERPAEPVTGVSLDGILVPKPTIPVREVGEGRRAWARTACRRDYLEREARNRELGLCGELLAANYEVHRLHNAGKKVLAGRVEHVSKTRGDGLGYDVLSYEESGRERFIEVKTTAFSAHTPFFVTPNEVEFSQEASDQFWLYRLFEFREEPRMFQMPGSIFDSCRLDPASFRATPL